MLTNWGGIIYIGFHRADKASTRAVWYRLLSCEAIEFGIDFIKADYLLVLAMWTRCTLVE